MDSYKNFVLSQNEKMPDPEADILRIASLHSWYKHLYSGVKGYPLLIRGEEPRYSWNPQFTDPDQSNFHWTIVMDYSIDNYHVNFGSTSSSYVPIPDEVKEFMRKFPINLDQNFSNDDVFPESVEQCANCVSACKEFWNALNK